MAEPVTSADLAEALNSVLSLFFQLIQDGDELPELYDRAETLLARYKAQQTESSKPALSEVEQAALDACSWWSDDDWRGASESMKRLRYALKKRGAL